MGDIRTPQSLCVIASRLSLPELKATCQMFLGSINGWEEVAHLKFKRRAWPLTKVRSAVSDFHGGTCQICLGNGVVQTGGPHSKIQNHQSTTFWWLGHDKHGGCPWLRGAATTDTRIWCEELRSCVWIVVIPQPSIHDLHISRCIHLSSHLLCIVRIVSVFPVFFIPHGLLCIDFPISLQHADVQNNRLAGCNKTSKVAIDCSLKALQITETNAA